MKTTILKVKNLTKTFSGGKFSLRRVKKEKITAVDDISFQISEGEIVGLLGPNGAGKTTTIQMILGLITPTSGSISVFGLDLKMHRKRILKEVNFSSTYTHLPWNLTVWENLYVQALLYGIDNPKLKVTEIIKVFSLIGKKDKEVNELSSGWTTRLNMAKAFLNNPRFILFDEPTASLDPESAEGVRQEIRRVRRKFQTTILFTSHNMAEVEQICDRVVFLDKGKIIARDTPEGLAKRIKISRIEMMIDDGLKRLQRLIRENLWQIKVSGRFTTVEIAEKEIPKFLNLLSERGISYREISIEKPTLEDFFLLTAKKQKH
ncbi:MAG: ABC transporter, ATPase subunit [Candidatus Gottesmanbacteria bacterium GW2011_GWC2_42_8]|nr:MAG: ABC transporter, ATPase subunit [Candidatus Gottesmanbacteria bacterium GW2011_GWC2_42_8]